MSKQGKTRAGSSKTTLRLVTSQTAPSVNEERSYGSWQAQAASKLVASRTEDTMLIEQISSIVGRSVGITEALMISMRYADVNKRILVKPPAARPSGFAGLLSALRAVFGGE